MSDEPLSVTVVHAFDCGVAARDAVRPTAHEPPAYTGRNFLSLGSFFGKATARAAAKGTNHQAADAAESAQRFAAALQDVIARHPDPALIELATPAAGWHGRIWNDVDPAVCAAEIQAALDLITTYRRNLDLGRPLPPLGSSD